MLVTLPAGTVTFLFTDIEGSTRLWEQHPEAMRDALARHDALAAALLVQHAGTLVKSRGEGDSLFAVFARATDAVAAACALQQALLTEAWPTPAPLRVRMALHTGEAEQREGDYYGPAVNRCARLRAIAHGGQVLLSLATEEVVREALPEGARLLDLGHCRLQDLAQPEHVFQLGHLHLPRDFPPLRSLEALPNNLPLQLTRFIGREQEMGALRRHLASSRLVTLTGSGGCGKTRLALQVAAELLDEFAEGVYLVELAPLSDPSLVPQAVASVLGVREEPRQPLIQTLVEALRARTLLLILDNCEHLLLAAAQLAAAILQHCPAVTLLASSREGLSIPGETTYHLPSLSLPDPHRLPPLERFTQCEAVKLFLDRASAAAPTFALNQENAPAVAQICCRLDGIPLALELAAGRVKAMGVKRIAERLDDRFRLLTGGSRTALPRQQTLQALIDWSYDLLTEAERVLLRRLSVFAGGWTLEGAEAVCADGPETPLEALEVLGLLTRLVEKSLVGYEEAAERYRLLETVRQYARDRLLESSESAAVRERHLAFYLGLAEAAEPRLRSREQVRWLNTLEREHDNLRAALDWAEGSDPEAALRLAGALSWFWVCRNYWREGRERLAGILARTEGKARSGARARALGGIGWILYGLGDYPALRTTLAECLAITREAGDRWSLAHSLYLVCVEASTREDWQAMAAASEESLALAWELGDPWLLAGALFYSGFTLAAPEIACAPLRHGDYERAKAFLTESLALAEEVGDRFAIGFALVNLGHVAREEGDYQRARALLTQSVVQFQELGLRGVIAPCLEQLAGVAVAQGSPERAARLLGAAEALREAVSYPMEAIDRPIHERIIAAVRAQLDEETLATAWAAGRAMTLEQAVACALEKSPEG